MKAFIFMSMLVAIMYQSAELKHYKSLAEKSACPELSISRFRVISHGVAESESGTATCLYDIQPHIIARNAKIKKYYGTKQERRQPIRTSMAEATR